MCGHRVKTSATIAAQAPLLHHCCGVDGTGKVSWECMVFFYNCRLSQTVRAGENLSASGETSYLAIHGINRVIDGQVHPAAMWYHGTNYTLDS